MKYYLFDPTGNITVLVDGDFPADEIMKLEPACEQVGYISNKDGYDISIRMAGGEFCGNASMCAAYLTGKKNSRIFFEGTGPVEATIDGKRGSVRMPRPLEITTLNGYPLVRFKGIDHVIVENRELDPALIKDWCTAEAMGFMYLDGDSMKPLVYVKGADTLFWENSCGSGTSAVGEYRGKKVSLTQPCGRVLEYENGFLSGTVELIKEVELQV